MMRRQLPPDDYELAMEWKAAFPYTVYLNGDYRRYQNGYWPILSQGAVKLEVMEILKKHRNKGLALDNYKLVSVVKMGQTIITRCEQEWDCNPDVLVFQNGTLDISTRKLRNHSPDDKSTSALDYPYDPDFVPSAWNKMLSPLAQDIQGLLQEFAGYCLTTDTKYERALWLYGPPGGGKSTFIIGIHAMGGPKCCLLKPSDIDRSRFGLAQLTGKTIATSSEMPGRKIAQTDELNKIISGEAITVERKFQNPFEITPHVKIIWAMNELPHVSSSGNGLFRRIFPVEFPGPRSHTRDPQLKEQVKQEGPGILNWALVGLDRLRKRGGFEVPATVARAAQSIVDNCDVPGLFLETCCDFSKDEAIQADELYKTYNGWCEIQGYPTMSQTALGIQWRQRGLEKRVQNGRHFYHGVGIKPGVLRSSQSV